jgi:putative endonuclease
LRIPPRQDEAISEKWFMSKQYFVYITTNKNNRVLYTGVTNDLKRRIYEHKEKLMDGFTKKYNVSKLVYYEIFEDPENAILREKRIKAGSRQKKIDLIHSMNVEWRDLYEEI